MSPDRVIKNSAHKLAQRVLMKYRHVHLGYDMRMQLLKKISL
jgi:hypothetical protein